jgi:hypothetical protein
MACQIGVALIVGQNQYDIRLALPGLRGQRKRNGRNCFEESAAIRHMQTITLSR